MYQGIPAVSFPEPNQLLSLERPSWSQGTKKRMSYQLLYSFKTPASGNRNGEFSASSRSSRLFSHRPSIMLVPPVAVRSSYPQWDWTTAVPRSSVPSRAPSIRSIMSKSGRVSDMISKRKPSRRRQWRGSKGQCAFRKLEYYLRCGVLF